MMRALTLPNIEMSAVRTMEGGYEENTLTMIDASNTRSNSMFSRAQTHQLTALNSITSQF